MFRHLKFYYEYFVFTQCPWVEVDLGSLFSFKSIWISLSLWVEQNVKVTFWLGRVSWRRRWVR